ncbi:alpha-amylase 4N-like isoform X2 [Galleria mellonella]|uniref:alpha-amylase n=1 Tax=Galleria mellonella TaxID=7137 RepID=A0ABM3M873_GALME|nr:alpha-amylase 4N-like isoform X2 [Galleria mellonella]
MFIIALLTLLIRIAQCDHHNRTNQLPNRSTIVHLFEWKWKDIADECERFLAPHGFGGVQISPPSENVIIHLQDNTRPWYERYQVMSYKLVTRSGNREEFLNMTRRCNKVGVRIYADVVFNHMTADNSNNIGTAGSTADFKKYSYPAVPYTEEHFHHPFCAINNYNNVTEVEAELRNVFRGNNPLKWLVSWGEQWELLPSDSALAFIDNHDTQRTGNALTYKEARAYKAAIAFMLAHPYGEPRLMSSYFFNNSDQGPPSDSSENIISPSINKDDTCGNGWVCEHRWRQIYHMVAFRNAVGKETIRNWWDNGHNQIAFSRGNKGFIAFNVEGRKLNETLQTGLPPGNYCDVITGKRRGNSCTGGKVTVRKDGYASINLPGNAEDMHLAIHIGRESSLQAR